MNLENLDPSQLTPSLQDVETIAEWARRNGLSTSTAKAWAYRGIVPTLKIGKRRMVNSAKFRSWLLEQEWIA